MAEGRYLEITFRWSGQPKTKQLEPVFSKGLDWMRLNSSSWLVWTTSTPQQWYERLKPFLTPKDGCLILAVDIKEHWGQLTKWQWDWINKKRGPTPTPALPPKPPPGPPRPIR